MRDSLRAVVADMERADACRTLHETLSREAIAAALVAFDDLPQVDLDDIATTCHDDHRFDPEAAARCATEEAEEWRVELERQREDAAAYAEIAAHYAEHLEGCGGNRRRYSEIVNCTKARGLTPERIAAAKAVVFERHLPRTEPERVRNAIVRDCGRGSRYTSFAKRNDSFLPGEHAGDIVGRRIAPCVESQTAAFAAIRRFAGRTYAAAVDKCIERRTTARFGWRAVAACVRDAARRAEDTPFADALGPCVGSRRSADELVNCPDVPER